MCDLEATLGGKKRNARKVSRNSAAALGVSRKIIKVLKCHDFGFSVVLLVTVFIP